MIKSVYFNFLEKITGVVSIFPELKRNLQNKTALLCEILYVFEIVHRIFSTL